MSEYNYNNLNLNQLYKELQEIKNVIRDKEKKIQENDGKVNMVTRYNLFPLVDEEAYNFYVKAEARFWSPFEAEYSRDCNDYENLKTPDISGKNRKIKRLIDMILGFFSPGDGLVNDNLITNFLRSAKTFEETAFFCSQIHFELQHAVSYSLIITNMVPNTDEQREILEMVENLPVVKAKAELMYKYIMGDYSESERYVAFCCSEGILFCTLFTIIYWLRSTGKFQNFIFLNELIAEDEKLHFMYGASRYRKYENKNSTKTLSIVLEFVEVEKMFISEMLPEAIEDLNAEDMIKYLYSITDNLLVQLGETRYFNINFAPNFMKEIDLAPKSNLYEVRLGSYKLFSEKDALGKHLPQKKKELSAVDNLDEIDF
jgi:ribonucleotide reductase beta subunit family protein with ferritin-like domain